jgi:hypothetical protein
MEAVGTRPRMSDIDGGPVDSFVILSFVSETIMDWYLE